MHVHSKEMWTAIERLQLGIRLTYKDVKTKSIWEFGKFTLEMENPMCQADVKMNRHSLISSAIHIKMDMEVPNLFDVVCAKKKIAENERPLLEQTVNIVTQPSDNVINLGVVLLNQVPPVVALPLPTNVRKRSLVQAPALESADKKRKSVGSSSSGAHMTREPASKVDDVLPIQSYENPSSAAASKAEEFILGITAAAPKRLTAKGKKPGDDIK
ncbi:hypothetical protein Tco_0009497 [Tanacetum coccineum]